MPPTVIATVSSPISMKCKAIPLMAEALQLHIRLPSASVSGQVMTTLSQAIYEHRSVWLQYQIADKPATERIVDPYGLVYTIGYWYLAGYCYLREALRTFRVDRIKTVEQRNSIFERPTAFDAVAYVEASIAQKPWTWTTRVILQTTFAEAEALIPTVAATLEPVEEGVAVTAHVDDLTEFALFLLGLDCPIKIISPLELRVALKKIGQKANRLL